MFGGGADCRHSGGRNDAFLVEHLETEVTVPIQWDASRRHWVRTGARVGVMQ